MRFAIVYLITLLLVPVFGAQPKGKQRDQHTFPPPAHLPPPPAHMHPPPAHMHSPPAPRPPPPQPVDLSKVDTYGRLVHFKVHPSFSNKTSGVVLNSAPDKHGLYNIAPVNGHFAAGDLKGWYIGQNQVVKVHKDDITKNTDFKMVNVAEDILNRHGNHPPEVIHTRLNNFPAASSSNDQPGRSRSALWGRIRNKFGGTGGRRRR
ncbi:hypothetical protein JOM56_000719 [Amanita muscaria]